MSASRGAIIDAHHHLWDTNLHNHPWLTTFPSLNRPFLSSDLSDAIRPVEVAGTVVVQATATDEETEWLIEVARGSEMILGVVGWVDLSAPNVGDRIEQLGGKPLVGIRHQAQDEPDPDWLLGTNVVRGIKAAGDANLPFDLLLRGPQRSGALKLVGLLPEQRFVIDHLAKPAIASGEYVGWYSWMEAAAKHPNVFCKVSGLVTEADSSSWRRQPLSRYIRAAVELFGPDRCMFGSDWPVALLAAPYGDVVRLVEEALPGLSETEKNALWSGTAASFYGLEAGGQWR